MPTTVRPAIANLMAQLPLLPPAPFSQREKGECVPLSLWESASPAPREGRA
jgi:hypothetical protein